MSTPEYTSSSNKACHEKLCAGCARQDCKAWFENDQHKNCMMLAVDNSHTFASISKLVGLTRSKVCQVERDVIKRIRMLTADSVD